MNLNTPDFKYLLVFHTENEKNSHEYPEDPTQPNWGGQYIRKGSTNNYVNGPG